MSDPNANRPGYKETKVGWIPEEWGSDRIDSVATIGYGLTVNEHRRQSARKMPYLTVANFSVDGFKLDHIKEIGCLDGDEKRYALETDDILMVEGNGSRGFVGMGVLWRGWKRPVLHQNHLLRVRVDQSLVDPSLVAEIIRSDGFRRRLQPRIITSSGLHTINSEVVSSSLIPLPPLPEQKKIAAILSTCDELIEKTGDLIAAKQRQKKALMQQLLTGKKRLPGFSLDEKHTPYRFFDLPSDWDCPHIREVAEEKKERNSDQGSHAVLSCSKHVGFVESRSYFKKQVFSEDTSNYKVIRKGWFGFPSNHVEEGSIGLLASHESGIVSPIYTVFKTNERICPEYLYAVFKTETFRHIFEVMTSASVDRRGSLRWDAFGLIRIPCPSLKEQQAIAEFLRMAEDEIGALSKKLAALKQQKKALMQKLLTGQVRVAF